jgi:hypothetical protein
MNLITGKACFIAKIFTASGTNMALAASPPQPRHAHTLPNNKTFDAAAYGRNAPDDLMAGDDGQQG